MSWITDSLREFFRKGDLLLLTLCIAASAYGLVLVYSATRYIGGYRNIIVQSVAVALGILVYIFISSVDVELITERSWKFLLAFNFVFVLLTRTPLGVNVNGQPELDPYPRLSGKPSARGDRQALLCAPAGLAVRQAPGAGPLPPTSILQIAGPHPGDGGAHRRLLRRLRYGAHLPVHLCGGGLGGRREKRWFLLAIVVCVAAVVLIWPHVSDDYRFQRFNRGSSTT